MSHYICELQNIFRPVSPHTFYYTIDKMCLMSAVHVVYLSRTSRQTSWPINTPQPVKINLTPLGMVVGAGGRPSGAAAQIAGD